MIGAAANPTLGATPLLASSPISLRTMVTYIVGELQDRFPEFTNRCGRVVRALFKHLRPDTNWVWPSQEQLAQESETSETTVKRVYRMLRDVGVRAVIGAEVYDGPGPHDLPRDQWRNPDATVPTLDLYPLAALLPKELVQLYSDFVAGCLSAETLQAVPVRPPEPDPFTDQTENQAPKASTFRRQTPEPADDAETDGGIFSGGEATTLTPSCNVLIDGESKITQKRESLKKPTPDSLRGVPRPKLAPINRSTEAPATGAGLPALIGIGVWKNVARKIVKDKGHAFAEKLAAYARWRERRNELRESKAAYAYAVYRDWGPESCFPDDFRHEYDRNKAAFPLTPNSGTQSPEAKPPKQAQKSASPPQNSASDAFHSPDTANETSQTGTPPRENSQARVAGILAELKTKPRQSPKRKLGPAGGAKT